MSMPRFIFPESNSRNEISSNLYFLPRQIIQVLRFDFPMLKADELTAALKFKLSTAYPGGHDDLKYLVNWKNLGKLMVAIVIIFPGDTFHFYRDLIEKEALYLSFPVELHKSLGKDLFLIYESNDYFELFVYSHGLLAQSHVVMLGPNDFEHLIQKIKSDHPKHKLIKIRQDERTLKLGHLPEERVMRFEELFQLKKFPRVSLTNRPPKLWGLWGARILGSVVCLVLILMNLIQGIEQDKKKIATLKSDLAGLYEQAGGSNGLKEKVDKLEKRLTELRKSRGDPILEISTRLYKKIETLGFFTAIEVKDGKIHLEGRSHESLRLLEKLHNDPWFKAVIPQGIRIDPAIGIETFVFEGVVNYD